jgi:hypothetical protein
MNLRVSPALLARTKENDRQDMTRQVLEENTSGRVPPRQTNIFSASMENALKRLLRIHSHEWSLKQLNNEITSIDPPRKLCSWTCYCDAAQSIVDGCMTYLQEKGGLIAEPIYFEILASTDTQEEDNKPTPSPLENNSILLGENSFEQFVLVVEHLMKWQDIRYASSTGNTYSRIENASCSYQLYQSLAQLLSHWTSQEYGVELEESRVLPVDRAKQWRFQVIRHGTRFLKTVEKYGGAFLPSYEPNYDYVEFQDAFYEISSGECLDSLDSKIICFRYFPLSIQQAMQTPPRRWLAVLRNSLVHEQARRRFCCEYALLFRGEKQRRYRCLYLLGESQCGKSSLLAPLEGLYGLENVGVMSPAKQSSLEDLVGKRIGILDEFSSKNLSRENFLLLAEGQPMKISMKYRRNPRVDQPQHVIFSSNNLPHYVKLDESGAVQSRISLYRFYKLRSRMDPNALVQIRDEETPYVLLYCNRVYLDWMQERENQNKLAQRQPVMRMVGQRREDIAEQELEE